MVQNVHPQSKQDIPTQKQEIHKLALQRVREIEAKIAEEFGLKVRCAIEMEFFVLDDKGEVPILREADYAPSDECFREIRQ